MALPELDRRQIRRVTPRDLRSYAGSKGWERVEGVRGISVFRRTTGDLDQIIVPDDPTVDDYVERVIDAIRKIASFEQRSATAVLPDVHPRHDDIAPHVAGDACTRQS